MQTFLAILYKEAVKCQPGVTVDVKLSRKLIYCLVPADFSQIFMPLETNFKLMYFNWKLFREDDCQWDTAQ